METIRSMGKEWEETKMYDQSSQGQGMEPTQIYKYGIEVLGNWDDAVRLDWLNGNTL